MRMNNAMKTRISNSFKALTSFTPRAFQSETILKLLQGQNVLLRAPTGGGKTEAAIAPFLFANQFADEWEVEDFPKKLIYIVPLRTLATSLRTRAVKLVKTWEERYPPKRPLVVTLQTGENPEDPRFEGDIIFCTIDQILSSFLSIPYSVGRGSANVNAGIVFASYLVFDELHLLDPDRSFATTLKLLEQIQGISPYLLMTATLTHELTAQIQQEVTPRGVKPENVLSLVNVEGNDLKSIEGNRERQFKVVQVPLSAEAILQDVRTNNRKRIIVICNTVAKSQGLYQDLQDRALNNMSITLLHSRFLPEHRKEKETALQTIFAEGSEDDGICHVLISTQVVEAGINITSEVMHTQLCPMNALLQRAGRCARFKDEKGQVLVYRQMVVGDDYKTAAQSEDDTEEIAQSENRKSRQFLPYKDKPCELTWEILLNHQASPEVSSSVSFDIEEIWINAVHGEEDRSQSVNRRENRSEFETNFDAAIFRGDRSTADKLIRFVDNRSVFMLEDFMILDGEASNEVNLKQLQAFSLPRTTLIKIWREYCDKGDRTWIFKKVEPPDKKQSEGYSLPVALPIKTQRELTESIRLIVNPSYVSYDCNVGLQIGTEVQGSYQSEDKPIKNKFSKEYSYRMDTYLGHLGRMWTCWEKDFDGQLNIDGEPTPVVLKSGSAELKQAGGRFIQRKFFPEADLAQAIALFELLIFLAVITHDIGKLQMQWQAVMRGWQAEAYKLYQTVKPHAFRITNPAHFLLAHTDHHPEHPDFKKAYDKYTQNNRRPPHAAEGAFVSFDLLESVLVPVLQSQFIATEEQTNLISHTIEMSAGRHHSAWAKGWEDSDTEIKLHPQVNLAIAESWQRLIPRLKTSFLLPKHLPHFEDNYKIEAFPIGKAIQEDQIEYLQLYWLVVRALRISDGRSVQLH